MHKRGQNTRVSRGERGTEGGEEGGGRGSARFDAKRETGGTHVGGIQM